MMTRSAPAVTLPAVTLLAVTLLLSACPSSSPSGGPSGGGTHAGDVASQLIGRTFLSTAVTGRTLVGVTRISLSFPKKGKLTAQAGCNHLFGDVSFEGDRMKVDTMGNTDMGCERPRHDQDDWLTKFLTARPRYTLSGNNLVLTGDKEEIKLVDRKVADPDRPLLGTRWVVESLLDRDSASSVPQGAEAFLQFDGDMVTGNAGCNRLSGKALHQTGTITFSEVVTTKMACAAERGALENAVLAVLNGVVAAKVDADRLELKNAGGKGLHLRSATEPRPSTT